MSSIAKLREYRERLQDSRFSEVRSYTDSNGESVSYRSQAEIEKAIAVIDAEINQLQRGRNSLVRPQTSKGL